jgi:hypothetical protein
MIGKRNLKLWLTMCSFLLALVSTAAGATLHVPSGEYPSIQSAIDAAAVAGDQIEVAPGTYNEAINFNGKAIRLYSSGGPAVTTIDATGITAPVSVVTCTSGEGSGTILEGFTITGGSGTPTWLGNFGGGMSNYISSPTVTNCIFSGNQANAGAGMANYIWDPTDICNPTVTNCTFSDNTALGLEGGGGAAGGGMFNGGANVVVTNCLFIGNDAEWGGAMWNYTASPTVTNCTFSNNTGGIPGMYNEWDSHPTVTNCILWGNGLEGNYQIVNVSDSTVAVTYSDVQLGTGELWFGEGCIDEDPLFVGGGDYRLQEGSPCIDVGNDAAVTVTTDLDGNPRIQGLCVDMGAFEALAATPETMLAGLRTYIQQQVALGNIDAEMEVSLLAKVNAAIAALNRGNPNDAKVAMNDLKALINQVEAQTDKKIKPDTAAAIIDRANAIITALGG